MKTTLTITLIGFLIFGFTASSKAGNLSEMQKATIEKQVDSVFQTMVKWAETLDYDKISKGVDDSKHAGFIVNDRYYPTYELLMQTLKGNQQSGTKQRISFQNKKITVLSDSIVLLTASGVSNVELNTGQSFQVKFLWSFVYEKTDKEWKVIQSHQSVGK